LKITFYIIILFTFLSCGKSPLFNHQDEADKPNQNGINFVSSMQLKNLNKFIKISWVNTPSGDPSIENEFIILVQNGSGELVDLDADATFSIWGWMPSMGHGTADDGHTTRLSKGIYHHRELFFNMGGDWQIHLDILQFGIIIDSTETSLSL